MPDPRKPRPAQELQTAQKQSEEGAGSILAISLVAAIISALVFVGPLNAVLLARARISGAADAAALAAADTAIGLNPGIPCQVAASVAHANGTSVSTCWADGVIVTVRVSAPVFGFIVFATATAGPPDTGH